MDDLMKAAAVKYIRSIKESQEYREYAMQLEMLRRHPDLYSQVNEYRSENYKIQNIENEDMLLERMDELSEKYEKLREIPMVDDFLKAEVSFCRMMQDVNRFISEELEFN